MILRYDLLHLEVSPKEAESPDAEQKETERPGSDAAGSIVCLACGRSIPEEASRCQICGWTWEEPGEE